MEHREPSALNLAIFPALVKSVTLGRGDNIRKHDRTERIVYRHSIKKNNVCVTQFIGHIASPPFPPSKRGVQCFLPSESDQPNERFIFGRGEGGKGGPGAGSNLNRYFHENWTHPNRVQHDMLAKSTSICFFKSLRLIPK